MIVVRSRHRSNRRNHVSQQRPQSLQVTFPSQGWRQFLTGRKEILDAYDKAREHAKAHETETYHGRVAEGAVRKWLAGFLPKRYGVTSGYIVSPGLASNVKLPHFDVIIYDQIESPVLWLEDNSDNSAQGRSLAVPVEYVLAVLEVKSNFAPREVTDRCDCQQDRNSSSWNFSRDRTCCAAGWCSRRQVMVPIKAILWLPSLARIESRSPQPKQRSVTCAIIHRLILTFRRAASGSLASSNSRKMTATSGCGSV